MMIKIKNRIKEKIIMILIYFLWNLTKIKLNNHNNNNNNNNIRFFFLTLLL